MPTSCWEELVCSMRRSCVAHSEEVVSSLRLVRMTLLRRVLRLMCRRTLWGATTPGRWKLTTVCLAGLVCRQQLVYE